MSLISVALPVRNGRPFLREAVLSILSQTHRELELIVVDDGSTDGSLTVLSDITDSRLRLFTIPSSGVFYALNRAIAESGGSFFARMDSDDIALPERLQKQLKLHEETGAEVIGGGVVPFALQEEPGKGFVRYCNWLNSLNSNETILNNIFVEDPIPSPTLFMPMHAIKQVGGYDPDFYPDDYNLTLKNYSAGFRFAKVPETVLRWRDHPTRLSRTATELSDQRFFDLKIRVFKKTHYDPSRPLILWGKGKNSKSLFKKLQANAMSPSGFTVPERFIREPLLYDLPVKPPERWEGKPYFLLATAATAGREEAEVSLEHLGYAPFRDYLAFCQS